MLGNATTQHLKVEGQRCNTIQFLKNNVATLRGIGTCLSSVAMTLLRFL